MTIIKNLLSKLFSRPAKNRIPAREPVRTVELEAQPDLPEDFGFKMNWFAIKTADVNAVLKVLDFGPGSVANWRSGIRAAYSSRVMAYDKDLAFVTPPVNGWIIVAGSALPYPVMHTPDRHEGIGDAFDVLFARLAASFSDVQFFGSYRGVGFVAWLAGKRVNLIASLPSATAMSMPTSESRLPTKCCWACRIWMIFPLRKRLTGCSMTMCRFLMKMRPCYWQSDGASIPASWKGWPCRRLAALLSNCPISNPINREGRDRGMSSAAATRPAIGRKKNGIGCAP
ncbi:hypothetical protein [Herbaspirillum frisingense]|uniref:hypothetical protein n=1 Tax=Herbaspirillum frisingense TaxID=92645 RepID=UPI001F29F722|nr:hypothetical protein [Herbaspirillum frisingense]UIN20149.1 hypothetical protein LAZ82_16890 [Herbaspirillum frisingense]